jgi:hypothetical protein
MGKTSFARHLAFRMASRCLAGKQSRVPILLSLGAISREQSIEGLLGATLTGSRPFVQNYNYPLFTRLNQSGRFVIILDGFDEMKHFMTHAEFQANFDEINRLSVRRAKVILLGRPSVFLSDEERLYVLRGQRRIGGQTAKVPDAPVYRELTIRPFSPEQVQEFVRNYIEYIWTKSGADLDLDYITRRQKEIESDINQDLISRPVHARMLAEIATDRGIDIRGISRFRLYSFFVHRLIEREIAKVARRRSYRAEDRRQFACDLAWFLWTDPKVTGLGCRVEDIPDLLFDPYRHDPHDDIGVVKRELLSGSFLEEKSGGVFYIPHRSFQEFLVAEYLWDKGVDRDFLMSCSSFITFEIIEFIDERDDKEGVREFFENLAEAFEGIRGPLSMKIMNSLCNSVHFIGTILSKRRGEVTGWSIIFFFTYLLKLSRELADISDDTPTRDLQFPYPAPIPSLREADLFFGTTRQSYRDFESRILARFAPGPSMREDVLATLLYCLIGFPIEWSEAQLAQTIVYLLVKRMQRSFFKLEIKEDTVRAVQKTSAGNLAADIFDRCVSVHARQGNLLSVTMDLNRIFLIAKNTILDKNSLSEVNDGSLWPYDSPDHGAAHIDNRYKAQRSVTTVFDVMFPKSLGKALLNSIRDYYCARSVGRTS